jgi:hypothetical protein
MIETFGPDNYMAPHFASDYVVPVTKITRTTMK